MLKHSLLIGQEIKSAPIRQFALFTSTRFTITATMPNLRLSTLRITPS